jgi:hypothetical protein
MSKQNLQQGIGNERMKTFINGLLAEWLGTMEERGHSTAAIWFDLRLFCANRPFEGGLSRNLENEYNQKIICIAFER